MGNLRGPLAVCCDVVGMPLPQTLGNYDSHYSDGHSVQYCDGHYTMTTVILPVLLVSRGSVTDLADQPVSVRCSPGLPVTGSEVHINGRPCLPLVGVWCSGTLVLLLCLSSMRV
jgi:hypothetical protein